MKSRLILLCGIIAAIAFFCIMTTVTSPVIPLGLSTADQVLIERESGSFQDRLDDVPESPTGLDHVTMTLTLEQLTYLQYQAQRTTALTAIEMQDRGLDSIDTFHAVERLSDVATSAIPVIGVVGIGVLVAIASIALKTQSLPQQQPRGQTRSYD